MRSDSSLVTGLSSASSRKLEAQRRARELAKRETGERIKPHEELIRDEFKIIRNEVIDEARAAITADMSEADVKAIITGARWAEAKLTSLQTRLLRNLPKDEVHDEQ